MAAPALRLYIPRAGRVHCTQKPRPPLGGRERERRRMKQTKALMSMAVAAALLLTACGKDNSSTGSSSMGAASPGSSSAQSAAWRTGLAVLIETEDDARTGTITTVAAAVLLDADGKLIDVTLDELEVSVSADGQGNVTMPSDYRTKRQKGSDYPLAAASSLKKGWAEQADAFAAHLKGMTAEQAAQLKTDDEGKALDADLLSGCTIKVEPYRRAVAQACENAQALGAARGDRLTLGIEAANASSDVTATDDRDLNAQVDVTVVALTADADGRVTSAIGDMAEPALTVAADGTVTAPDTVRSKLEQGDDYGMRGASALGKEWYEHSQGFCAYLKGKTEAELMRIPTDGSDADLAALCTIDITDLQKAAAKALQSK